MLDSQKLQLRISEIRSRLNEISGLEGAAFTEEIRQESDTLTKEFREAETKYRSSVVLEDEETRKGAPLDAESAEIRSLNDRAELRNYLMASLGKTPLDGVESELNSALIADPSRFSGVPVPWSVLAPPVQDRESRADAATSLPASGPQILERDFVGRVFAEGSSDFLGVRFDTVPSGEASYFVMGSGLSPEFKAAGSVKDAQSGNISGKLLEPKAARASYIFRLEDLARSPNLEESLRLDLRMALRETIDNSILNGATDGPTGILAALTAPDDPTSANASFTAVIGLVASGVDGRFSRNFRECRLLTGSSSYQKIAASFATGVAVSTSDYLLERSGGLMASDLIPDEDSTSHIQSAILAKIAVFGNSVGAVWDAFSISVRDETSRANRAEIKLTAISLFDHAMLRADGYTYLKLKLA